MASGTLASKNAEFTAWVVAQMDGWPGNKDYKRKVIELLYDAYRQGRIHGMDAMVNPMRQCVANYDNMVANSGKYIAKLVQVTEEAIDANSNPRP